MSTIAGMSSATKARNVGVCAAPTVAQPRRLPRSNVRPRQRKSTGRGSRATRKRENTRNRQRSTRYCSGRVIDRFPETRSRVPRQDLGRDRSKRRHCISSDAIGRNASDSAKHSSSRFHPRIYHDRVVRNFEPKSRSRPEARERGEEPTVCGRIEIQRKFAAVRRNNRSGIRSPKGRASVAAE